MKYPYGNPTQDEHFQVEMTKLLLRVARPFDVFYRIITSFLALLCIGVVMLLIVQYLDRRLPTQIGEMRVLTPNVHPEEDLVVRYDVVRSRQCQLDVSNVILDGSGSVVPLPTDHRNVSGPLGKETVTRRYHIPANAKPGPSRLRVSWAWQCPMNLAQVIDPLTKLSPDILFNIVE